MILFFSNQIEGDLIILDEDESKHCLKVLRQEKNGTIHITDGRGNLYEATITDTSSGRVRAEIQSRIPNPPARDFRLHIAIAPTKNSDRLEWFIEKSAEMGIDEISPVFCSHSERNRINHDRLRKILISALKQSLNTWLPELNEAVSFRDFLDKPQRGIKLIASCISGLEQEIQQSYTKGHDAVVLIGPEGDFSDQELDSAIMAGYIPVSLGRSRLRTETAGVYATAAVNLINRM